MPCKGVGVRVWPVWAFHGSLLGVRSRHGVGKWSKISNDVPGRTDAACRRRWQNFPADRAEELSQLYVEREDECVPGSGEPPGTADALESSHCGQDVDEDLAAALLDVSDSSEEDVATVTDDLQAVPRNKRRRRDSVEYV